MISVAGFVVLQTTTLAIIASQRRMHMRALENIEHDVAQRLADVSVKLEECTDARLELVGVVGELRGMVAVLQARLPSRGTA